MTRRRQRARGSGRCRHCGAPVVFFRSPFTGRLRTFDPRPVDPGKQLPRPAYPVENQHTAWRLRDLVEDLQVRRSCTSSEAEDEARAMPWHHPHECPQPTEQRGDEPR